MKVVTEALAEAVRELLLAQDYHDKTVGTGTPRLIAVAVDRLREARSTVEVLLRLQKPRRAVRHFKVAPGQGAAAMLVGSCAERLPLKSMTRKGNKVTAVYEADSR